LVTYKKITADNVSDYECEKKLQTFIQNAENKCTDIKIKTIKYFDNSERIFNPNRKVSQTYDEYKIINLSRNSTTTDNTDNLLVLNIRNL
jgi:hypothetical protein